jgi:predicted PurR-regulated permease PerM
MNDSQIDPPPKTNRWMLAVLAAAFILFLAYLLRYVLLPFIVAGALAYVATPAVRWIQFRLGGPRWLAALVPFIILLAFLTGAAFGIKAYLLPQVNSLLSDGTLLEQFLQKLFRGHEIAIGGKQYSARAAAQTIMDSARSNFDPQQAIADIGIAAALIMGLVLTIVLFLYFLVDGPRIARGIIWVVPPAIRPEAAAVGRRAGPVIHSYVRGVIIVATYATTLTFLVTKFLLHVQNSLLLSIAIGFLELIPVIGPVIAVGLLGFVAIEQMTFWSIIGVILFITGLRLSIDQFVGPVVLGRSVKIPPPLIIFAFMAGGAIWGVLGVVVAIPAAAIIKIILEEAYAERSASKAGV